MGRKIFYGICAVTPGGILAFAALALVDKETRTMLVNFADKTVDSVKKMYRRNG